jgi:hypothetical protein
MRFCRFDQVLEEFGSHIFPESTKWFNSQCVVEVCTCDGEEGAICEGSHYGSLAHDVKEYTRLLRAGKGRELVGEFEFQRDTIYDAEDGVQDGPAEIVADSAGKPLETRTEEKEE